MWIAIAVGGLLLVVGNTVVTLRLWRSQMYERSQQIAQTAIVWVLPGSAVTVNWFLGEPSRKEPATDPTYSNDGATKYDPPAG